MRKLIYAQTMCPSWNSLNSRMCDAKQIFLKEILPEIVPNKWFAFRSRLLLYGVSLDPDYSSNLYFFILTLTLDGFVRFHYR